MTISDNDVYKELVESHGERFQYTKAIEECGELIVALSQKKQHRVSDIDVLKEVADVAICLETLKLVLTTDTPYETIFADKMSRTKNREGMI